MTIKRSPFNNAQRYFITAKKATPLLQLLKANLNHPNPELIIQSQGVHGEKKRLTNPHELIQKGQTIRVYITQNQGRIYELKKTEIILETAHFIIVNKPAGLTTVPDRSNATYNLQKSVHLYLEKQGSSYTPQPLNRLDFMVSGLVLFSKTKVAEKNLFQQMRNLKIKKAYLAKLDKLSSQNYPSCLRIKDYIGFGKKAYLRTEKTEPNLKVAHSLFIKTRQTDTQVHYLVVLFTGKRHQIRAHCAKYLSPISGDDLYGSRRRYDDFHLDLSCIALNFTYEKKRYRIRLPGL